MKQNRNKADFIFRKRTNETLKKLPGTINGLDFAIKNLENCEV